MKFWVIHAQEPLPQPRNTPSRRLWRSNTIAEILADRGHEVVRWRSGFSHYEKTFLVDGSPLVNEDGMDCQYLAGPAYQQNIGLRRVAHHRAIAAEFARLARASDETPDLIHVANVPLELCEEAVRFGAEHAIPVVVDIRDLWPDIYLDFIPHTLRSLRPMLKLALHASYKRASNAMSGASAITGITSPFVDWGLKLAGRPRTPDDRVFHMSYPQSSPGTDPEAMLRLRTRLGLSEGDVIACYFGNIGHQSDFDTLLEAARLLQDLKSVRIVVCGTGPKLGGLRARSSGTKNLVLPGWLQSAEIQQLMKISAIGLLPFKERDNYVLNMPNKFSEYLSGGLAIACGVRGEMANLVRASSCGFVYPTGDAKALALGISTLANSPEQLARMKSASLRLFARAFDCGVVYAELCKYLESIAQSQPDPRPAH